jgi:uracil-DNA glycosylase
MTRAVSGHELDVMRRQQVTAQHSVDNLELLCYGTYAHRSAINAFTPDRQEEVEMRVSECVGCKAFPCADVKHDSYIIPDVEVRPEEISIVMISEAAPANAQDYYYAEGNPLFQQTTVQAFNDAGVKVSSIRDILGLGVYLTTAVKCGKTGYGIKVSTIKECSVLLERELALFPMVGALLCMGDVAIKAINEIARRAGVGRVIPPGSTYKIRHREFYFHGKRVLPSYLQAGPSYFIEKSKRAMISQDIATALTVAG